MNLSRQTAGQIALALVALGLAVLASGCIEYLDEGELGRARYFGEVRGAAPLTLLPPISDREGNVYVAYGSRDLNQVEAFVGHAGGGWTGGCTAYKGDDRGTHGWVGREDAKAWYHSGDALVEVDGTTGDCKQVLDIDPTSGASLLFEAVIPMVIESPSRDTVVAMIRSAADALPFHVVVDLDLGRYSQTRAFEPAAATDVKVLGQGADRDSRTGFVVVSYRLAADTVVEAIYFNDNGDELARAPITGAGASAEDSVLGYLQSTDGHVVVGLLETGEVLRFSRDGGSAEAYSGMTAVGVHKWLGNLYLVGSDDGTASVAPISNTANVAAAQPWLSSATVSNAMSTTLAVLDERSEPRQTVGWQTPTSAIGSAPFLSSHSLDAYAEGTTGWLLAGPTFQADTNPQTAVAFAPVGVSYH